jgi:hypothetical protein
VRRIICELICHLCNGTGYQKKAPGVGIEVRHIWPPPRVDSLDDVCRPNVGIYAKMDYSYRSATMGSTRVDRRAGIQQAAKLTAASRTTTAT